MRMEIKMMMMMIMSNIWRKKIIKEMDKRCLSREIDQYLD